MGLKRKLKRKAYCDAIKQYREDHKGMKLVTEEQENGVPIGKWVPKQKPFRKYNDRKVDRHK